MEQSEQERLKAQNARGEFIHRKSDEKLYEIETPRRVIREAYPWEVEGKEQKPSIVESSSVQL